MPTTEPAAVRLHVPRVLALAVPVGIVTGLMGGCARSELGVPEWVTSGVWTFATLYSLVGIHWLARHGYADWLIAAPPPPAAADSPAPAGDLDRRGDTLKPCAEPPAGVAGRE